MSLSPREREAAVLQSIVPNLEAEGFQVFLEPGRAILPPFMHSYRPDAIAIKPDKKLVIEVASVGEREEGKIQRLQELLSVHPDWELRVYYAPPRTIEPQLPPVSERLIIESLERPPNLYEQSGAVPALLTGWAILEAIVRSHILAETGKPLSSSALVQFLAGEGYITPSEADLLRRLAYRRNEAAHGRLDTPFSEEELNALIGIARAILDLPMPMHS